MVSLRKARCEPEASRVGTYVQRHKQDLRRIATPLAGDDPNRPFGIENGAIAAVLGCA